jgi:hypothetical protein
MGDIAWLQRLLSTEPSLPASFPVALDESATKLYRSLSLISLVLRRAASNLNAQVHRERLAQEALRGPRAEGAGGGRERESKGDGEEEGMDGRDGEGGDGGRYKGGQDEGKQEEIGLCAPERQLGLVLDSIRPALHRFEVLNTHQL